MQEGGNLEHSQIFKRREFACVIQNRISGDGCGSAAEWGAILDTALRDGFREQLSAEETAVFDAMPTQHFGVIPGVLSKEQRDVFRAMFRLFDEWLLFQFESITFGWRFFFAELVQRRMSCWNHEPNGPEKYLRVGKGLSLAALRLQGKKLPPISDAGIRQFKKDVRAELNLLLPQLQAVTAKSARLLSKDALLNWIAEQIPDNGSSYANLHRELESFLLFLSQEVTAIERLRRGSTVPVASLIDEWLSWRTGRSQEQIRQAISGIGRKYKPTKNSHAGRPRKK